MIFHSYVSLPEGTVDGPAKSTVNQLTENGGKDPMIFLGFQPSQIGGFFSDFAKPSTVILRDVDMGFMRYPTSNRSTTIQLVEI